MGGCGGDPSPAAWASTSTNHPQAGHLSDVWTQERASKHEDKKPEILTKSPQLGWNQGGEERLFFAREQVLGSHLPQRCPGWRT